MSGSGWYAEDGGRFLGGTAAGCGNRTGMEARGADILATPREICQPAGTGRDVTTVVRGPQPSL
jgi:hypothetical protein